MATDKRTIEEKAKRYDEIIARATGVYLPYYTEDIMTKVREFVEYLLPELKESEDEKVRKGLIEGFSRYDCDLFNGLEIKSIISWLKKQGEQKPVFEMKTPEESLGIDSETHSKIVDECIYGEQKPVNKVEPKFKVGDKIISTISNIPYYITEVCNGHYLTDVGCVIMFNAQNNFDLIEQKPIGKPTLDVEIPFGMDSELVEETMTIPKGCYAVIEDNKVVIRKGEKPAEWSEEDSPYFDDICELLMNILHSESRNYNMEAIKKDLEWFKSLKDRVQPRQEWSEEDKKMYNVVHDLAWESYKTSRRLDIPTFGIINDWLKSLRPQSQWKPNDAQMEAIKDAIEFLGCTKKVREDLESLYEQLKKLKG